MSCLKAGFARVNINPEMGIPLRGYFIERLADGILDDIEVNALALECNSEQLLLISVDNCGIEQDLSLVYREMVSQKSGVKLENIILSATHTHNAPEAYKNTNNELVRNSRNIRKRSYRRPCWCICNKWQRKLFNY